MTADDPLVRALIRASYAPATAAKRMVYWLASKPHNYELSEKMEKACWRLAYSYRRQLPKDLAEEAIRRKMDHDWKTRPGDPERLMCAVCRRVAWSKRELNMPCPGPVDPKPEKKPKYKTPDPVPEDRNGWLFGE